MTAHAAKMRNIDFPERVLIRMESESGVGIKGLTGLSTAPHFWQKISPVSAVAPHFGQSISAVSAIVEQSYAAAR